MARKIYAATHERDRPSKKKELARILSVSESKVYEWLGRIDKDTKAKRDRRVFGRWLACWTNAEIAKDESVTEEAVRKQTQLFPDLEKVGKPDRATADHATDFDPPLYNVWKQQTKTAGSDHFPRYPSSAKWRYAGPPGEPTRC